MREVHPFINCRAWQGKRRDGNAFSPAPGNTLDFWYNAVAGGASAAEKVTVYEYSLASASIFLF
jgi:hypothetical protein